MAQTKRSAGLSTRAARQKIRAGGEKQACIAPNRYIIYRRPKNGVSGRWFAQWYDRQAKKKTKKFIGVADDRQNADGTTVLTYAQTQAQADAWFRLQESLAPKSHDKTTGSGPYTVSDALDDYFSERERQSGERARRDKITANASIIPALGGIEVARLGQRRIEKWLADLAESPRRLRTKPGAGQAYAPPPVTDDEKRARRDTANRILTILKAALNFVFKRGLVVAADPCWQRVEPFKRTSKARVRFLKKEEQVILVNVCPPDFRALVMAALLTGCRYGELSRMKCGDYDPGLQNPTIFIADSKSGKPRHVYLSKEGKALFEKLTAKRDTESHIFTRSHIKRRSRKDLGARWGRDDQASFMKAACKAAGFKITFHELRHTYASTLVNSGCPLQVVAHQLGHSNTKMVEKHYGHLAPSYIADAVRAVMPTLGIVE
ncbi:MAG: site-specific integrase [Holophagales bacterium]|nr:site-specific integrase [Holophagales bacterium]